ncbi:MAG: peptide-methionine (S)-S-oxide reductase MsrA [Acidobacteria bacterium]|jgi:peptide-methionine (S)-S-oxide reductase|nr:peptide-methionine (S)-S-oxide reductase MsrA [Acidobacteriota bacterium]
MTTTKSSPPAASTAATETATLGGGCFWCIEAVYERIQGVAEAVSGYAGGHTANPTYEEVCTGTTGHAEVVQVRFDPKVTSYREILKIFFAMHDPTTLDRQGADAGTQYRSIILTHSPAQQATAEALIRELTADRVFDDPIVTEVAPLEVFYPAEVSHQEYYDRNPNAGYCRVVISPKLAKLKKVFASKLKN